MKAANYIRIQLRRATDCCPHKFDLYLDRAGFLQSVSNNPMTAKPGVFHE
jgi:hypothetical protein